MPPPDALAVKKPSADAYLLAIKYDGPLTVPAPSRNSSPSSPR